MKELAVAVGVVAFVAALYGAAYFVGFNENLSASSSPMRSDKCSRCGNSMILNNTTREWHCIACDGPIEN